MQSVIPPLCPESRGQDSDPQLTPTIPVALPWTSQASLFPITSRAVVPTLGLRLAASGDHSVSDCTLVQAWEGDTALRGYASVFPLSTRDEGHSWVPCETDATIMERTVVFIYASM